MGSEDSALRGATHVICILAAGALVGLSPAASRAQSSSFDFESLADSSGLVLEDFQDAKLNDDREVVFFARELASSNAGLFRGPNPASDAIADTSGSYTDFFDYAIGDDGTVVFLADAGALGFGYYTGPDPAADVFVDSTGVYSGLGSLPAINSGGTIVFLGSIGPTKSGLFNGPDPMIDTLVDDSGPFEAFLSHPALNDAGTPVFVAKLDNEEDDDGMNVLGLTGVFTGPDPVADRVADSGGEFDTFTNYSPSINNLADPDVVFWAKLDNGVVGIYTGPDPSVDQIADSTGSFNAFGNPAINDRGMVAFRAVLDNGGVGIFTGPDAVTDRLIGSGDALFGGTVVDVSFAGHGALNDQDEIVFVYELDSGVTGVARAPEPGAPGLAAAVVAALWALRRAGPSISNA